MRSTRYMQNTISFGTIISSTHKIDVEHFITLQYFLLHYNFETTLGTGPHGLIYIAKERNLKIESAKIKCFLTFSIGKIQPKIKKNCEISIHGSCG
jgi:hypothetical protein